MQLISSALALAQSSDTLDDVGLPFSYGACKVLDLLGYGSFIASNNTSKAAISKAYLGFSPSADDKNPLVYRVSQLVNLLPLFTYQKIYYDFFSNSQWEKHLAYSYNVDYWDGKSQLSLSPDMFKLRYANYPKDYFMGILPNSQYGAVAYLHPSYNASQAPSRILAYAPENSSPLHNPKGDTSVVTDSSFSGSNREIHLNSDLSAPWLS